MLFRSIGDSGGCRWRFVNILAFFLVMFLADQIDSFDMVAEFGKLFTSPQHLKKKPPNVHTNKKFMILGGSIYFFHQI